MPQAMHVKWDLVQILLDQFVAVLQRLGRQQFSPVFAADEVKRNELLRGIRILYQSAVSYPTADDADF